MQIRKSLNLSALLACALSLGQITRASAQAPAAPAGPPRGTTLTDRLQAQPGDIRTLPKVPRVGSWGLLLGRLEGNEQGAGVQIEKVGQAIVYPTIELLSGSAGTIEFSVIPGAADAAANRVLLDSWAIDGPSRFMLSLLGGKLTLTFTDAAGAAKTIEGNVTWVEKTPHKIDILWDANEVTLLADSQPIGKIEKPALPAREPLGLSLGNSRDFQNPARAALSDLRLSTAREPVAPLTVPAGDENLPDDELTIKTAQGYQRRLYPLLERLRAQNVAEVTYAYAVAYSDIGDLSLALTTVTPLAADVNNPLNVQAVFLRSDILGRQSDYNAAYEQLQVLAGSRDPATSVRAQVKQAAVLFDQGNKQESLRLIGEIIARYTDLPEINDAYLMVGLDKFRSGDFDSAYKAFKSIGIPGAPPRQSVSIGAPLEIKVADADLNVRLTDAGLPVTITATSGDKEQVVLKPAFSRGVYIGSVETVLGEPNPGDNILQLVGTDKVRITYTDRLSAQGADQQRVVTVDVATDADLTILALAALDVYREVRSYQKKNILDDRWEIVGALPKNATSFFRDPDTGLLRRKGWRFDRTFITNIKPGQSIHVELNEPDEDRGKAVDTIKLELSTQAGKTLSVTATETGPHTGVFTTVVKTTPVGKPQAGMLEAAANDIITARYSDPRPAAGTRDPMRLSNVAIRANQGSVAVGLEVPDPNQEGVPVFMRVYRVSGNNTALALSVEDRDLDSSDAADKATVRLKAASGADVTVTLTESGTHTGHFTGAIKLTTDDAATTSPTLLKAKSGDRITATYVDEENPSGQSQNRDYNFKANIAENATMTFLREIVTYPKVAKGARLAAIVPPTVTWEETKTLVPGFAYRAVLSDPDVMITKAGEQYTKIVLKSTNGSPVEVPMQAVFEPIKQEITFQGSFFVRLGDAGSPLRAFFSQTGSVVDIDPDKARGLWSLPALNLQGKDEVQATYIEPLTADVKRDVARVQPLRVAANGEVEVLNAQGNTLELLKPGMAFDLHIKDADGDVSPKRDTLKATLTSSGGDKMTVELTETDAHSGIFSNLVKTSPGAAAQNASLEVPFEGKVTVSYNDEETMSGKAAAVTAELRTKPLGTAEGVLLTKVYGDPKFELETLIRLGESLYAVGAAELTTAKIPEGQPRTNAKLQDAVRILQQVIERFPTSDYVVESLYLTGKIRREERKFDEAQALFTRVIEEYPDNDFVPQALFQLVLLHYAKDDIENSTEAAMKLVYGFPKNPLVADAFLRIAEFYYGKKQYITAAYIYKRVIDRFPDNPRIELISYRRATSYYRAGLAGDEPAMGNALRYYLEFADGYSDHELADDAMYWAANISLKQGNTRRAYTLLTKQLIAYSQGDMKAVAERLRDKIKEENPAMEAEQS